MGCPFADDPLGIREPTTGNSYGVEDGAGSGGVRLRNRGNAQGRLVRYVTIGGGCGGCVLSLASWFHPNWRSTTPPGSEIAASARRVARNTANWPVASPGNPSVSPNGRSTAAIRGTPVLAVSSGIIDSDIVLNPAASISHWTSPTDQQHTGQTGTSTTASMRSCCIRSTMDGTASCSNRSGRSVYPT